MVNQFLSKPPTDWEDTYLTINSSGINDPSLQGERFWLQPGTVIFRVYRWCRRASAKRTNELSHTIARVAELVEIFALQGKPVNDWHDYLPFRIEDDEDGHRVPGVVQETIRRVIKAGRVPLSVAVLLREALDEAPKTKGLITAPAHNEPSGGQQ
jgi:hypothetical protein